MDDLGGGKIVHAYVPLAEMFGYSTDCLLYTSKVINTHGATTTAEVLDNVKAMGYKYSTQAAVTVSIRCV